MLVRGLGRGRGADLALALAVGACIAGYTLVDDHGLRHAAPIGYLTLVLVVAAMPVRGDRRPARDAPRAQPPGRARGRDDVRRLRARAGGARARRGGAGRRAARDERGHGRDRRGGRGALEGPGARVLGAAWSWRGPPRSRSAESCGASVRRARIALGTVRARRPRTRAAAPALHSTTDRARTHIRTPPRRDVLVDPHDLAGLREPDQVEREAHRERVHRPALRDVQRRRLRHRVELGEALQAGGAGVRLGHPEPAREVPAGQGVEALAS